MTNKSELNPNGAKIRVVYYTIYACPNGPMTETLTHTDQTSSVRRNYGVSVVCINMFVYTLAIGWRELSG